ncbi:MAG: DUF2520 domain-containing protein, partial [Pyrinomonadaceae bacterium]|nr:DUF2520 domain-containing protein [Sphingobacteriaceae bacterium]
AAVFACNFSNHVYTLAAQIVRNNNLDFDLLKPLILETAEKVLTLNPLNAQTGPALRDDKITLNHHLEFLKNDPHLQEIYQSLSQSIINLHQKA